MMPTLNLLFHMHHETEEAHPAARAYAEVLALIRQADQLSIGCVWLAEHHLSPTRGKLPAPLLLAVAAARETRRVRVGPCVLLVPLANPVGLAEQIATADLLAEGRLQAGLGSGGNAEEFAGFGVPLAERKARFAEGLDIVAGLLAGGPFSYAGSMYHVPEITLSPRPLQDVAELIWVAAGSVDSARLAGRAGGHLLLARGMSLANLRDQHAAYAEARALAWPRAGAGRVQVTRGLYVAATDEQAWKEATDGISAYLRATGAGDIRGDPRELARRGDFIIGSPQTCAAAIRELTAAVPITDLACDIALLGMDQTRISRSLALLGQDVAALLAGG